MLAGLQCGRAVAAVMVAIFHANVFLLPSKFYAGEGAGAAFNFGYAGVEFFFVLSGFIMVLVHRRDFGQPSKALVFMRKRVVRIYPIYWLVMAFLLAIYFVSPGRGPDHARDPLAILQSLLLIPSEDGPIMQVAWTLQHEMLFYIIFSGIILNLRIGRIVFGAWMLACVLALPWSHDMSFPLSFLLKPHNLLFLFGIVAAYAYTHLSRSSALLAFWTGCALFLGIGLSETVLGVMGPESLQPLGYGLGALLIVIGLAQGGLPAPRWLTFIGDASYAIYLVHLPVMNIAAVGLLAAGLHLVLPPLAMLALITVIVTVAGALVHIFAEKPLMKYFKNRSPRQAAA